ncbi:MAG: hypothetical protein E6G08_16320 [Actinobacteria bacterium]|nr:MAG: hypothetical protein E6G08_16320 [Actinomycetota bacterium]
MKSLRLLAAVCALTAVGVLAFASTGVAARPASAQAAAVPISTTDPTGTFTGTFTITRFIAQNGQVAAVGTLVGTVTNTVTGAVTAISQDLILPLLGTASPGSCPVLHLELGPLDLDLLGVVVHLDKVVLDITAQSGPGNLLGNLLCAVSHLLDSNASATAIAGVLNNLLGLI